MLFVGLGPIMTAASQITTIFQFYSSPIRIQPDSNVKLQTTSRPAAALPKSVSTLSFEDSNLNELDSDSFPFRKKLFFKKGSCSPWSVGGLRTFSKAAFGYNSRNYRP